MTPLFRWIRSKIQHLFQLKDRPHAIALGTGLGVFWGFTPIWGFKTLLAMGSARLFRGNVIASVIGVTLHDIILPLLPVLMRWQYQAGYWLLSHPHQLPPDLKHAQLKPADWMHWSTLFTVGRPLLLGSLLFAIPLGLLGYALTLKYLERRKTRLSAEATPEHPCP
jgi:uncharacterized protein (DUF2062 family)